MIPVWLTAVRIEWALGLLMGYFLFVAFVLAFFGINYEPVYDNRARLISPRLLWDRHSDREVKR